MGHLQPSTPMTVDNCTAIGVVDTTMKQRQSKVFDKNKDWLRDRMLRGQFDFHWGDGKSNLADMPTKFPHPNITEELGLVTNMLKAKHLELFLNVPRS